MFQKPVYHIVRFIKLVSIKKKFATQLVLFLLGIILLQVAVMLRSPLQILCSVPIKRTPVKSFHANSRSSLADLLNNWPFVVRNPIYRAISYGPFI